MEQLELDIEAPILIDRGLGGIETGMNVFCLRRFFSSCFTARGSQTRWEHERRLTFDFYSSNVDSVVVSYRNIISIYVNLYLGKVEAIEAKEGYLGRLWGRVAIGDEVKKVEGLASQNGVQFDMSNVHLEDGYLWFKTEKDHPIFILIKLEDCWEDGIESQAHWHALMERKIEWICLRDSRLSMPMFQFSFPRKWLDSPFDETILDIQLKLDTKAPIVLDKGLGGVDVGLNTFFLRRFFQSCFTSRGGVVGFNMNKKLDFDFADPYVSSFVVSYRKCIEIDVNLYLGKICSLTAKSGYRGKVWREIGIGDKVKKIEKLAYQNGFEFSMKTVQLEDGSFCFSSSEEGLLVMVKLKGCKDNKVKSESHWLSLMTKKIESITLYDPSLSIPLSQFNFPRNWVGSSPERKGVV